MSHEDLQARVAQRPFVPFRITLTEGTSYDVRHPELFMLGRRAAVIGLSKDPEQTLFDSTVLVDLLHVVRLEPLPAGKPSGDGSASGS